MKKIIFPILSISIFLSISTGCSSSDGGSSSAYPSDAQVIRDVMPKDKDGLVSVQVVEGKEGEAYLHSNDLVWYWDRGVVVKRKAKIAGAPDAVVVVGGLARYQKMGDQYKYAKFLTTYNEYEGMPAPNKQELVQYVKDNLKEIFISRDHNITDVSRVTLDDSKPWIWHSADSFSVPFTIQYKEIASYTQINERVDLFDVRFYRNAIDAPLHALMATEKERQLVGSETFSADEITAMKTLKTSFK